MINNWCGYLPPTIINHTKYWTADTFYGLSNELSIKSGFFASCSACDADDIGYDNDINRWYWFQIRILTRRRKKIRYLLCDAAVSNSQSHSIEHFCINKIVNSYQFPDKMRFCLNNTISPLLLNDFGCSNAIAA